MPRTKSPTLTEAELRLMEILWERGPSAVSDVVEALPKDPALAYSTVLTTLRILEDKGYISHTKQGRAFVYSTVVDRGQASQSVLRYILKKFFHNSPELLVLNVLRDEEVDADELARLKKLIAEAK